MIEDAATGALTVVGGKLTTYRAMAQDAVDRVTDGPCRTHRLPLVGAGRAARRRRRAAASRAASAPRRPPWPRSAPRSRSRRACPSARPSCAGRPRTSSRSRPRTSRTAARAPGSVPEWREAVLAAARDTIPGSSSALSRRRRRRRRRADRRPGHAALHAHPRAAAGGLRARVVRALRAGARPARRGVRDRRRRRRVPRPGARAGDRRRGRRGRARLHRRRARARGRGVASEALRSSPRWAFEERGIQRAYLLIDVDNPAVETVAERAGYTARGRHAQHVPQAGPARRTRELWSRLPGDPPVTTARSPGARRRRRGTGAGRSRPRGRRSRACAGRARNGSAPPRPAPRRASRSARAPSQSSSPVRANSFSSAKPLPAMPWHRPAPLRSGPAVQVSSPPSSSSPSSSCRAAARRRGDDPGAPWHHCVRIVPVR